MGHRNNLQLTIDLAVEHAERISTQQQSPRTVPRLRMRSGAAAIRRTALSTPRANPTALSGLRSSYQSRARRTSTLAAGWNLTLIQTAEEVASNLLPWDRPHGTGVEFRHPPPDFYGPRSLHVGIWHRVEGLDQHPGQRGTVLRRQIRGLTDEILQIASHGVILPGFGGACLASPNTLTGLNVTPIQVQAEPHGFTRLDCC